MELLEFLMWSYWSYGVIKGNKCVIIEGFELEVL